MRKYLKRTGLIILFLFCLLTTAFAGEREIAENFIKKAYLQMERNSSMAAYFLEKSFEYADDIPEYYYLKNRLLPDTRDNLYLKKVNVDKLVENLGNYFYVDDYLLIKSAIEVYEKTRSYDKAITLYKILLSYKDRYLLEDYLSYIEVLFYADRVELVEGAVQEALRGYSSLDLFYYYLLARIKLGQISDKGFADRLRPLFANNYSRTKQLYLKVLYYNSRESLAELVADYYALMELGGVSAGYNRKIIYELLMKSALLDDEDRVRLLESWLTVKGLSDYRTADIIRQAIPEEEATTDLAINYLYYTGMRSMDSNEDGLWEEFYRFEKGILKDIIFDVDQNGLYEKRVEYYRADAPKFLYLYRGRHNYDRYHFNELDGSLVFAESYIEGAVVEKTVFLPSTALGAGLESFNPAELTLYIDYKELFSEGYIFEKYYRGELQYINCDFDEDGLFEYKKIYKEGKLAEGLRDTAGDGFYDTLEQYVNGRLKRLFTRTDPAFEGYDYKEEVISGGVIKYWDANQDNIFEISIEEYDGLIYEKYDIDFDGSYDYAFKTVKDSTRTLYKVMGGRYQELYSKNITPPDGKKGWVVVSARDIEGLAVPDWIDLKDRKNYSGIFSYKGEKLFFKNGLIEANGFKYGVYIIEGKLFLFDMMR